MKESCPHPLIRLRFKNTNISSGSPPEPQGGREAHLSMHSWMRHQQEREQAKANKLQLQQLAETPIDELNQL
jgi:hypothetical protein